MHKKQVKACTVCAHDKQYLNLHVHACISICSAGTKTGDFANRVHVDHYEAAHNELLHIDLHCLPCTG